MLAGFAVATVEVALGVLALRTGLAPYLFVCAATTIGVALGAHHLLVRRRDDPGDDDSGGPRRGPDEPPPPPWWPDFERRFRAHVRERERPRHPVH
jgi:hypothetical protein